MSKHLNLILSKYSDVISGKFPASKVDNLTLGSNPGVDYAPVSKGDRDFIAAHSVEMYPDRNGNGDDLFKASNIKMTNPKKHGNIKPKDAILYKQTNEAVFNERKDEAEYGYEGEMAITQLKTISRNSKNLMMLLKPDTDLPEWVQSKITKAEDYISTAYDYLASEMTEEVEQIAEAIKLNSKVRIHDPGKKHHGEEGAVVEFRRGLPGVRPSYYTVDHGGTSTQFTRENIKTIKEEEAQRVYEEHMSEKDAERLAQKHVNAAAAAKKAGNLKSYDAHAEASNYIRDKILAHTDSAKGIPSGKIRSTAKKLFIESSERASEDKTKTSEIKHDYKGLKKYVDSLPKNHIDRDDLLTAVSHMAFGNESHLAKHLETLDTDVRDKVKEYMKEKTDLDEASKSSMSKPKLYTKRFIDAAKFNSSNISKMVNDEKARKAAMKKEEVEHIDEANSHRKVDDLKSEGEYRKAGELAAESRHPRQYGPHFGMRSGKEEAQRQFFKGYDSVKKTNEEPHRFAESKCNMTEAGIICEIHGKQNCSNEETENPEDKNPKHTGKKDKSGKQLLVDKMKKYISEIRRV